MRSEATGSHSAFTDGNSLHTTSFSYSDSVDRQIENHVMPGFPLPSTLGEAMNNIAAFGQMASCVTISNSDELLSARLGKSTRDFSSGTSFPSISNTRDNDRFIMEGIPLAGASAYTTSPAARYGSMEYQEKLITCLDPFAYPSEHTNSAIVSDVMKSSAETLNYGYEGFPYDTSTRWDFNKFITPAEFVGSNVRRSAGVWPSNEWIITEQGGLNSNGTGSSRFSNELSLSLATSQPSVVCGSSIQDQCSEITSSGVTSYSLHKRSERVSCSTSHLSRDFETLQFPGSVFLHAMQEILAEIACYALENFDQMSCYSAAGAENVVNGSFSLSCIGRDQRFVLQNNNLQEREVGATKKQFMALLQQVDDRYSQCLDEIHTVTSAFHDVTELNTNLHARYALPTISFMYKNLRERISSHILAMGAHLNDEDARKDERFETSFIPKQWALQQLSKRDHHFWRPQRGLPERSISVLRAWMFQNFLHPYPNDAEKHLLALKSNLTRNQVSNWFINARVRLWKPMIEEMYAEMNRRKARRNNEEADGNHRNHMRFENIAAIAIDKS